ncbi:MAG: diacylglycerol kinase family protein, partial [Halofilum sp. (in: g-proteobacteria)]
MASVHPLHPTESGSEIAARALLLFNPRSRRAARSMPELTRALERNGLELEVARADHPDVLTTVLAEHGRDIDRVLLAGGDGTIHNALPDLIGQWR